MQESPNEAGGVSGQGLLGWNSPWGRGFPGWHIECSAMIHSILGKQIDIHTGGIEHIAIHHNNEIAQSEAATGKHPFARFWMHRAHIRMNDEKLAKSTGNVAYLADVLKKGFHPLALRYWFLTSHYRSASNFTWEALDGAQRAFLRLRRFVDTTEDTATDVPLAWKAKLDARFNADLDTPGAIALLWEMAKDATIPPRDLKAAVLYADRILGFGLEYDDKLARALYTRLLGLELKDDEVPPEIRALVSARNQAREDKDWARADLLREELANKGYRLEDRAGAVRIVRVMK